jgi:coenzyme F420-reducing hydrogenase delta subunit
MCSGRVDLSFILRAFSKGVDGVFIGGCRLNECNYITHGNYDALSNVYLCRKLMERIGMNTDRLRIEFMTSGDGILLTEKVDEFSQQIREIGPLGESEGIGEKALCFKLEAATKLIPYIKLVERERLRAPVKTEEAYRQFFESEDVDRLFDELIGDKLAMSQIMLLLRDQPLSTATISETLGLNPSDVAKYMNNSSRQGFVRYDSGRKCYALASG